MIKFKQFLMQPFASFDASNTQKTKNNKKYKTMKKFILLTVMMLAASISYIKAAPAEVQDTIAIETVTTDTIADDDEATTKEEMAMLKELMESDPSRSWEDQIIPLAGIFGVFVCPTIAIIIIVCLILRNNTKRRNAKYELMQKAIDKGAQIPEGFFDDANKKSQDKDSNSYSKPIILLSVGLAGSLFFILVEAYQMAALVSMVWLIGLGNLIVAILNNRKNKAKEDTAEESDNDVK